MSAGRRRRGIVRLAAHLYAQRSGGEPGCPACGSGRAVAGHGGGCTSAREMRNEQSGNGFGGGLSGLEAPPLQASAPYALVQAGPETSLGHESGGDAKCD